PMSMLLIQLGLMGILYFSSKLVNDGRLFQGNVVALTNYMSQILVELLKLANLIILMVKSYASISRIEEVMERKSDGETESKGIFTKPYEKVIQSNPAEAEKKPGILMNYLSFSYDTGEERALSDISFSLEEGESLGIIGGTGSGKSTLVSLICGFYRDYEGEIFLWGRNLREYSEQELRESIAYVPQKAVLFSGTLKENLLWRKKDAKDEELWKALEIAQGKEFVEAKGEGLNLSVSIEGKNFSGGQRQRLSIARALVGDSRLLILDDSSSALDMLTERKLRSALEEYQGKKSLLVISQRVSSIRHLPKILVLDQGRLIGVGSHQELLENCSVYQEICASQKQGKEE
ncbi:MAG: ABC transporter ATP-binding protein, partial [Oribacterium sinus]|nr:ABC transporter ATP-binding protein [Oribacterium sinus]